MASCDSDNMIIWNKAPSTKKILILNREKQEVQFGLRTVRVKKHVPLVVNSMGDNGKFQGRKD